MLFRIWQTTIRIYIAFSGVIRFLLLPGEKLLIKDSSFDATFHAMDKILFEGTAFVRTFRASN